MSDQLATKQDRSPIKSGSRGIILQSFDDTWRFATAVANSKMAPSDFGHQVEKIAIAIQMGAEVGLAPMTALKNIAVINGRPSLWGDSLMALVLNSGLCENFDEDIRGDKDEMVAACTVKRKGLSSPKTRTFSVADAKKAGLWGKAGPWTQYPTRMLQMRARAFALRDVFPDVLGGFMVAEEAQDLEPEPIDAEFTSRSEELAAHLAAKDDNVALPVSTHEDLAQESDRTLTDDEQLELEATLKELLDSKWRNHIQYATGREAKLDNVLLSERKRILETAREMAKRLNGYFEIRREIREGVKDD